MKQAYAAVLGLATLLWIGTPGRSSAGPLPEAPMKAGGSESAPQSPPPETAPESGSTVKWGAELFLGLSTLPAHGLYVDGLWAGSSPWNPSTAYLTWENARGYSGKVAIGLGETFVGPDASHHQPAEAWLRVPVGPIHVTGGKYWTPFAGMEWQYESRPGVMLEWADSRHTLSVSLNPNDRTDTLNTYTRIGRSLGGDNTLGFSVGTGRGFSYDSPHTLGFGLDGAFTWHRWSLAGEHIFFTGDGSHDFSFSYARLEHAGPGRTTPFLGWYRWHDESPAFGKFQCVMPGVQYQLNTMLSVEAAWAATSERKVGWLQFHFLYE